MVRFMMKCSFIAIVLLVGVLIGMQQANEGMKKMRGYDDPSLQGAFTVTNTNPGEIEASVLGQKVTSHDIDEKQKQLEEVEAFNFFSMVGRKLGDTVSAVFEMIMVELSDGIGKAIEKIG
ncbi:YqxA family protein [Litchfieldia alkalitelluris]|uniref:YqxA family protein n=1 Tax=Litchfieldia alkalitelluris TaxID=304268 RepID=UPI00099611D2|nr:YqxA family protein [Litchfieldia alkalitelluris]